MVCGHCEPEKPKKIVDPKAGDHEHGWDHIKEPPRDTKHKGARGDNRHQ